MLRSEIDIHILEDATISGVMRNDGDLRLQVILQRQRMVVVLVGVHREYAVFYGPGNTPVSEPDPNQPVDFIEKVELDSDSITISGNRHGGPWHVWRIEAESIEIVKEPS